MARFARSVLTALIAGGGIATMPAFAGERIWHFFRGEEPAAFLAVMDEEELESPEPHYPFLMTCSLDGDWLMVVSDVDPKQLGETIARGDQPTFSFVATTGGQAATSGEYFPEISFGQMEGVWEYSSIWDLGTLDPLAAADAITIKGTGVELALPAKTMKESLAAFRDFCGSLSESGAEEPNEEEGEPP